jgi:hypothetical protein
VTTAQPRPVQPLIKRWIESLCRAGILPSLQSRASIKLARTIKTI